VLTPPARLSVIPAAAARRPTGDSATAVTQETWSNQEAGATAPEQATVRVTYTLLLDAAAGRWLIVESGQMLL